MKHVSLSLLIIGFTFILFIGCSKDKEDWESAKKTNSLESYQKFVQEYPESKFTDLAKNKIDSIAYENTSKENTEATDTLDITVGVFTVKVPGDWRIFSASDSDQLRRQYTAQSEEIYRQYSGASDQAKSVDIAAFHIAGDAGTFVIVSFTIPPQSDLINLLKNQAEEKAKWGIQQGYIQKYLGLVPLDDKQFSGFYTKFIGANGEIQISGGLEHKKLKNTLVQLTLLCPKAWDELKATKTLTSILESVKLRES